MSFDVKSFLEDFEIEYPKKNQHSTRGWINIQCPWEDCGDSSNHMGIHLQSGIFHCFKCDRKGPPALLISKLLRVSIRRAEALATEYQTDFRFEEETTKLADKIDVKGFLTSLPEQHRQYLLDRNFDPDELIRKYKIGAFGTYGRFPFRIAIPVFDEGTLVNLTARDVTGQQEQRYLFLKNEEAVVPRNNCVYNIDNCSRDNVLVVEGPFDVWRMGGATVSFFGTSFSVSQVLRVLAKFPKKVFILFDEGADAHSEKLANYFSPFVKHVEVLNIAEKDPACLSPSDALDIKNELGI